MSKVRVQGKKFSFIRLFLLWALLTTQECGSRTDDTEAGLNFRPDLRSLFEKVLGIYLKKKITADL